MKMDVWKKFENDWMKSYGEAHQYTMSEAINDVSDQKKYRGKLYRIFKQMEMEI